MKAEYFSMKIWPLCLHTIQYHTRGALCCVVLNCVELCCVVLCCVVLCCVVLCYQACTHKHD